MAIKLKFGSLETRLTVVMLLLSILPVAAVGWMAGDMTLSYIRSDRIKDAGNVADSKHTQLVMVLTRANNRAEYFLSSLVAQCGGNAARLNQTCAAGLIRSYLGAEGAIGAVLHEKNGGDSLTVGISAARKGENITFQAGQLAKLSGTGPENNRSYFISVTEKSAGLQLEITYPSSTLDPVFDTPATLGKSGETFLADGEGYFVTRPKYRSTQGHSHPISARPMRSCLSGQDREVIDEDYRDVVTIMGFRFIPEFGAACIMAHVAEEEAFAPLKLLEQRLIISVLVFCTLLIIITIYVAKRIVRPVTNLTQVALSIAKGNYTVQAEIRGNDEISKLAATFNFMTNQLYAQSAHLEDQVRARTIELEQAQQETAALLRRNQALMENSMDGITIMDAQGNILEANEAFCRMLGYTLEEMTRLNSPEWETSWLAEDQWARFRSLIGKSATFETVYHRKDGVPIKVEVCSSGVEMDEHQYILASSRDITERKRIEAQLVESLSSLKAINKSLDEFTYIAAHDLKEPLRGIHNYTSFLKEDYADRLDENARQYINSIQRLAERLSALIDRLLVYSRLGSDKLAMVPVDVDEVVDAVAEDLSRFWRTPAHGGMGIELRRNGTLGTVQGDATRIGEVFQNLISNAAKYNDKPSKWIEIGCDRSGATPVFYVRDNGIGIMPHHQDSVFRIFKRLHEQNKYGGGTGAGLTITKKIIELHGGRIWLESTPGEGTTFYFTLSEDI